MSVQVKICGLASEHDVDATVALAPDYLGFIFWPGSKRCVAAEAVRSWTAGRPGNVKTVGVFVDASMEEVQAIRAQAGLDIVQLHGAETDAYCASMDGPVWKVVHLGSESSKHAGSIPAEALLLDSFTAEMPGGTGKTVDWPGAANFIKLNRQASVVLAGGLTPQNVGEARRKRSKQSKTIH